jgi:hypothetical protein
MTKELMKKWLREVFFPTAPNDSLVLLDSWPSFKDINAIKVAIQ